MCDIYIRKLSLCCTDKTSLGFHVSVHDRVLNLQRGFTDAGMWQGNTLNIKQMFDLT